MNGEKRELKYFRYLSTADLHNCNKISFYYIQIKMDVKQSFHTYEKAKCSF